MVRDSAITSDFTGPIPRASQVLTVVVDCVAPTFSVMDSVTIVARYVPAGTDTIWVPSPRTVTVGATVTVLSASWIASTRLVLCDWPDSSAAVEGQTMRPDLIV